MSKEKFSIGKRLKSFSYGINGIKKMFVNEHNARIHLVAALLSILLGIGLDINPTEWALIILCIGFVMALELANTAIERLADRVSSEWDETIGLVKDYSAGAVLIAAICALLIGGIIFLPKLWMMYSSY